MPLVLGLFCHLKKWWDIIISEGQKLGYYVNESKSWLIIKDRTKLETAKQIFGDSNIKFTCEGKRHLGAAIGTNEFRIQYVSEKVEEWCKEMKRLSALAKTQPHAAFSAYIHGEQHKFTYFLRTTEGMNELTKPLDDIIMNTFLPAIFGETLSPQEKGLFALLISEDGLGIEELSIKAPREYEISKKVTQPLVTAMVIQSNTLPDKEEQQSLINEAKLEKQQGLQERSKRIEDALPVATKQVVQHTKMVGASNWLNAIPLAEHGFNLSKSEFRDALALRFNHNIKGLPSKCPCGQRFDVTHAMNCKRGGFVIMRHNDIRDLLKRVCNNVEIEPPLQPLTNKDLERGAINTDSARLDVRARGFWRRGQNAFINVRVTNPGVATQSQKSIQKILQ